MAVNGVYCSGCVNNDKGICIVKPDGAGSSGIMLVGDSPWVSEIASGKPFAGMAGGYLNRTLWRLNAQRQDFTITNAMWCKPPRLGWTDHPARYPEAIAALRQCRPYLSDLVRATKPRVLLAMGGVALLRTTGYTGLENRHSYVHQGVEDLDGLPVVPTYHPSYIMQGKQKLTPAFMFAVRRAQEIAAGTYRPTKYELLMDPSPADAKAYLDRCPSRIEHLMVDIETPESSKLDEEEYEERGLSYHIIRAGFSHTDGTGISFPWEQPYIDILAEAMRRSDNIWEWADRHFDTRRLRAASLSWTGRIISGMWAHHFLQSDLLKGLGFVAPFYYAGPPWKHLSQDNPAYYNAMDQAVGRDCSSGSMRHLQREGRWDRFVRHCVEVDPIHVRMGAAGLRIDRDRQSAFMSRLHQECDELLARLQMQVPEQVKKVKVWVRRPKDLTDVREVAWTDGKPVKWERTLPFNPASSQQTISLMKSLGIKPPKAKDSTDEEEKETAQKKHLLRMAKKHPVFKTIIMYRERKKLTSSYNWPLDQYSRVYTTLGFHPSTWRSSSRNVALQTIPKRSDLADDFRKMIVASPGHVLVAGDSAAIEAVIVGYCAGSDSYINLARAGVHAWLTSYIVPGETPIPYDLPPAELKAACKLMKQRHPAIYEVAKRIVHMSNYVATAERIWEEYPEEFEEVADAKRLQLIYLNSPAGKDVVRWQQDTCDRAHRDTFLLNHFNYKHYFYEVYRWNSRLNRGQGGWAKGDDAKRAVAFVPQSDACAIQREFLLALDRTTLRQWLRMIIHDEIVMEVPEDQALTAATALGSIMTQPIRELGGLVIGAEVKVGRNFGKHHAAHTAECKEGCQLNIEGMREVQLERAAA